MKTNWTDFAAKTFLGQYFQEGPLSKKIEDKVEAIAEFYFKNGIEFESQDGFKNLTDAFGDSGFLYGTHLMAEYEFYLLVTIEISKANYGVLNSPKQRTQKNNRPEVS